MSAKGKAIKSAAGIAGLLAAQDAEGAPFGTLARQLGKRTREAWHGSPHVYDQVDMSRMGSGEGNQAYGAGYYAAEDPQVAQLYLEQLAPGRGVDAEDLAASVLRGSGGDERKALAELNRRIDLWLRKDPENRSEDWYEKAQKAHRILLMNPDRARGGFYRLEIPDEDLLDWDAPLSEQPEKVQAAIKQLPGEYKRFFKKSNIEGSEPSAGAAYASLAAHINANNLLDAQKFLSRELQDLGVLGIRYFDGMSRSQGEGTRNYVIFDDRNVNVVERNGQPVAAMPRDPRGPMPPAQGFATPEMMAALGVAGGAGVTGAEAIAPSMLAGPRDAISAPKNDRLAQFAELLSSTETGLPLYGRPFQETGNLLGNIAYGEYGEGFPTSGQFAQDVGFAALEFLDPASYAALFARKPEKKAGGGMTDYKMKPMADALASRGRYGDQVLVHMNPAEVAGIASLAPGGKLTTNPDTGLPEAFLPFLAPILGSIAGKAFLPAIATKLGGAAIGSALSPALAGALGSGLATGLAENSFEKGLLGAVTGFGLGSAMGAGAGAAKAGVAKAASEAANSPAALEALRTGVGAAGQSAAQMPIESWGDVFQSGISDIGNMAGNAGEIGSALMQPGTMLPTAYGLGSLASLDAMDQRRDAFNRRRVANEEDAQSWIDLMNRSFYRPQMADGGITSVDPQSYMAMREQAVRFANGGLTATNSPAADTNSTAAARRQAALRGPYVNRPPEGFRPGIDPEFQYFSNEATDNTINPDIVPGFLPGGVPQFGMPNTGERSQYSIIGGNLTDGTYEGMGVYDIPQWALPAGATLDLATGEIIQRDLPPPTRDLRANPLIQEAPVVSPEVLAGIGSLAPPAPRDYSDYLNTRRFAEGGMVESEEMMMGGDDMVAETVRAILGEHENGDAVISMFVEKHGPEVFAQLRTRVLNGVVPGAQTEGQMKGNGGGMDDELMGMIGSSQPVALSTDEFVVPADVVASLGDGSSDAGAKVLYEMMDSVRKYKGGTTKQPRKMSPEKLEQIKLGRP